MEKIEVRVIGGFQKAFYKGEELPFLLETTINQSIDEFPEAVFKFRVSLKDTEPLNTIKIDCSGDTNVPIKSSNTNTNAS